MRIRAWILVMGVGLAGACGPVVPVDEDGTVDGGAEGATTSTSNDPSTTGSMPNPTMPATTSHGSLDEGGSTTDTWGSSEAGGCFLCPTDVSHPIECDLWLEDCPKGEKCMPWANDGGASWNATKCVPIDPDADGVGEPCTAEGNGVSGIDSCDIHSMCWYLDTETLEGTCVAFCTGTVNDPGCADACSSCQISGDGVLNLCLPHCDPIEQNCGEGLGCYLGSYSLLCAPDASGNEGATGDACEYINDCDPGLQCVDADSAPDCEGVGCCMPYCQMGNPTACDAVPGTVCTSLGLSDPGCHGDGVGLCMVP